MSLKPSRPTEFHYQRKPCAKAQPLTNLLAFPDAEYCLIRAEAAVPVPAHLDAKTYAPILCAGLTIFNSIRHMNIPAGSTVGIHGLGGLGHLAVQYAAKLGHRVVAISRGAAKEAFARELGAHEYVDSSKVEPGKALQEKGGAALVITTAPSGESMPELLTGLGVMGKLLILSGKSLLPEISPRSPVCEFDSNGDMAVPGEVPFNTGVMVGSPVTCLPSPLFTDCAVNNA